MITIGYEIRKDDIYFFVTDTGKGIAEENISRVFDRFAKLDSFTQGTGLGLSICELIIKHLGGEIGGGIKRWKRIYILVHGSHPEIIAPSRIYLLVKNKKAE